jgi:hypothetical protein
LFALSLAKQPPSPLDDRGLLCKGQGEQEEKEKREVTEEGKKEQNIIKL